MQIIKDVYQCRIYQNKLIISYKNGEIEINENEDNKFIVKAAKNGIIGVVSNFILLPPLKDGFMSFFSLKDEILVEHEFKKYDFYFYYHSFTNTSKVLIGIDSNPLYSNCVMDLNTNEIILKLKVKGSLLSAIFNDKIVLHINGSKCNLFFFDLVIKKSIWQTDLSSYGTIDKIIGIYNNLLWVSVDKKTVLVHIETGIATVALFSTEELEINYNYLWENETKTVLEGFGRKLHWYKDEDGGEDYARYQYCYFEIDTLNVTVKDTTLYPLFKQEGITPSSSTAIDATHYYMVSNFSELIALNRQTKQIDWRYQLSKETMIHELQFGGGKLYALDKLKHNLYIFEKEIIK